MAASRVADLDFLVMFLVLPELPQRGVECQSAGQTTLKYFRPRVLERSGRLQADF
jgi:hypothetical protein